MKGVLRNKPAIIVGAVVGLTAIVFVAQAFFSPQDADTKPILDYVLSLQRNDSDYYTNPMYGFSLRLPKDFIISNTPQDPGDVIIAEHPTFNLGLEIFITPFD